MKVFEPPPVLTNLRHLTNSFLLTSMSKKLNFGLNKSILKGFRPTTCWTVFLFVVIIIAIVIVIVVVVLISGVVIGSIVGFSDHRCVRKSLSL